ncbi:MAG: DUF3014 domain-containing protein [Gammaproteobacteria bacterium]|nr:DUF3014 domain-containing protein [Gammaproteobacteria bacterium]
MNKAIWIVVAIATLIAVATLVFLYGRIPPLPETEGTAAPQPSAPAPPAAEPPAAEPDIRYPIPAPEVTEPPPPLPALEESDGAIRDSLAQSFGETHVEAFLIPTQIIRHFVATIDSLDRDPVPLHFRPIKHVPGLSVVKTEGDRISLSPDNAKRYAPFISALRAAGAKPFADLYLRYYPLFQKAYEDLGYPERYFNDRLIDVMDYLLAAPEIEGPIELVQPKVLYQFADPELEKRSWGQKALIRMGPANAAAVKEKLREIRDLIAVKAETP